MAQVKLLTSMAGVDFSHNAGDVIDCTDAEAVRYVAAGIAEAVAAKPQTATAKRRKETRG